MSDDLVERVARAFCVVDGADPCEVVCDWCLHRAAPVVAACMEEAADAVGEVGDHADLGSYINAIRALKESK